MILNGTSACGIYHDVIGFHGDGVANTPDLSQHSNLTTVTVVEGHLFRCFLAQDECDQFFVDRCLGDAIFSAAATAAFWLKSFGSGGSVVGSAGATASGRL